MPDLKEAWQLAWADLSLHAPAGLCEELLAAYEEPQRHYHSLQHLAIRVKRKAVLKSFLDRAHLYNTPYFRERCEAQARSNLAAACA